MWTYCWNCRTSKHWNGDYCEGCCFDGDEEAHEDEDDEDRILKQALTRFEEDLEDGAGVGSALTTFLAYRGWEELMPMPDTWSFRLPGVVVEWVPGGAPKAVEKVMHAGVKVQLRVVGSSLMDDEEPKKPNPVIQAEILKVDELSGSGLVYPRDVVEAAIKELKPHMTMNRVLGEFDPPKEDMQVRLSDAATMLKSLYFKDDVLMADLEILDTPKGKLLKEHLRGQNPVLIAPRAFGEVEDVEDGDPVVRKYTIVTVDAFSFMDSEGDDEALKAFIERHE